ncbi:ATP-binding protein [Azospirillum sp. ST 5-10]|uniref:ATP-binding protein n=1 Tax=unclassified Azospirillum TaxID=2630922 RepID=UPI003F4A0C4D
MTGARGGDQDTKRERTVLRTALDALDQGLVVVDGGLRLVLSNRRAAELLDVDPAWLAAGASYPELVAHQAARGAFAEPTDDPDARGAWDEALTVPTTFKRRRPDGAVIEVRSRPLGSEPPGGGFVRTFTDVTAEARAAEEMFDALRAQAQAYAELRDTQASLVQAEKMASLAVLVAGVAHEINTPVGIAYGCATHLSGRTGGLAAALEAQTLTRSDLAAYAAAATEAARLIEQNLGRAAALIRSFKQVAVDRTSEERRRFDLTAYLREVVVSLGPHLKPGGHAIAVTGPEGLAMDSYPGALAQVVANLAMNALAHAYDGRRGGRMTLSAGMPRDGEVEIRFADDGAGIPADVLPRIFEPFFTTRRGSGGSGLGLHIVFNLVTQTLSGRIAVDSTPGGGATFTVRLPCRAPQRG